MSSLLPDELPPGQALEQVLSEMEGPDRPAFLAHLERKYRAAADLKMLREIKAYRDRVSQPSTKPHESA